MNQVLTLLPSKRRLDIDRYIRLQSDFLFENE